MGRPRLPLRPRGDLDRGAAAVEFALLLPLFLMLLFGMISSGLAFSRQISITQAARETSRYASTLSFQAAGGQDAWLDNVSAAANEAAGPAPDPIGGYDYRCVAYVEPGGQQRHKVDSGPPQDGSCTVPNDALGPAYVEVVLKRNTSFSAVLFSKDIELSARSVTPFEALR